MNKIKVVSVFFRVLFQLVFLGLIFIQVIGWTFAPLDNWFNVIPTNYQAFIPRRFDLNTKIAGFLLTLGPLLIKLLMMYFLIKLFRLYARHEFFSKNNVRYIRNAGYALLLEQIVNPVVDFFLGFILTSANPPGFRYASMIITESNIGLILTALLVILVSWIMSEGCKLHDEQRLTI